VETGTSKQTKATIAIAGYRIDSHGIHDRFLPWRHFGFWKYGERARLESNQKSISLTFRFNGRKKPLKVQVGNTFSNALKMVNILEKGIIHSPSLAIDPETERFLEEANRHLTLKDKTSLESQAELKLAKAKFHIRLGDSKAARKETKELIASGNEEEAAARNIRLYSYLIEADETLARVEFEEISKRFPTNQEARAMWASWLLAREASNSEEFAHETIRTSDSLENRLEVESQLVNYLARQRRYDEALEILDKHLVSTSEIDHEQRRGIEEAKAEIQRLKTDISYNRRMTIWQPLKAKIVGYGVLILVGLFLLWPAILETPQLISDWQELKQLEASGLIASSGKFSPNLRDLDFGFVQLSFVFSLKGESASASGRPRLPDHYGSVVLRRAAADKILADTRSHSVTYLAESPFTCTVSPITQENYIGIIAKHAGAYLMAIIVLVVILFYCLKDLYKNIKYGGSISD
jgi:tetratricopeptide (TPR) repeat protein